MQHNKTMEDNDFGCAKIVPHLDVRQKNKMKMNRPIWVFCFWSTICVLLYSTGAFIFSAGWNEIDKSSFRDFLYLVLLFLLPASILAGLIHLLVALLGGVTTAFGFACGLLAGAAGALILHIDIQRSSDAMAHMNYNALPWVVSIFGIIGLLLGSLATFLIRRRTGEPVGRINSESLRSSP